MPDEFLSVSKYPSIPKTLPVGENEQKDMQSPLGLDSRLPLPSGHWTHPGRHEL
jgi:hypothetical protein